MDKEILRNVTNQLTAANDAMCKAINQVAEELTNNGNSAILFSSMIDSASVDPLVRLEYNINHKCALAVSKCEDYFVISDLTANELYDICWYLILGKYQITDLA